MRPTSAHSVASLQPRQLVDEQAFEFRLDYIHPAATWPAVVVGVMMKVSAAMMVADIRERG